MSQDQVKTMSKETVGQLYSNLITFINRLPLNPQIRGYAFMNLDQGMYWANLGIDHMQVAPEQESAATPDAVTPAEKVADIQSQDAA
jgi:hypothetical protein